MLLKSGASVPYWQVTSLEERAYDVADMPMEGEMDSTFFLTKEKNFIPHTYPCRTAYIAERRGKEIAELPFPDWRKARNILPGGSPFRPRPGMPWTRSSLRPI